MVIGIRYLLLPLIHSIVVTVIRLTRAPLQSRVLCLLTRTLIKPSIKSITLVLSILYTSLARTSRSYNISFITLNQCVIFLYVFFLLWFQCNALTLRAISIRQRFSRAFAQFRPRGLRGLLVVGRQQVTLKAKEGINFICISCLRSDIYSKYLTRASSLYS